MAIVKRKAHQLIQDDDCHWYLIPCDHVTRFRKWVDATLIGVGEKKQDWLFFTACRVDGPHCIQITDWVQVP